MTPGRCHPYTWGQSTTPRRGGRLGRGRGGVGHGSAGPGGRRGRLGDNSSRFIAHGDALGGVKPKSTGGVGDNRPARLCTRASAPLRCCTAPDGRRERGGLAREARFLAERRSLPGGARALRQGGAAVAG